MKRNPYVCYKTRCRYNQGPEHKDGSCNYCLVTGRSRIAQHPEGERLPKYCRLYAPGDKLRMTPEKIAVLPRSGETPTHSFPKYDWAEAEILYRHGARDAEIAEKLECSIQAVRYWRRVRGYKARKERKT